MEPREDRDLSMVQPITTETGQRVFLIRHADASEGDKDPELGRSLSEIGVRQAEALAKRVACWQLEAIVCSDMTRAYETASAMHEHHPDIDLIVDPVFREVSTGTLEAELDLPDRELITRLEKAWEKVVTMPHRVAAIVTHNGLIKYLIGRTIGFEGKLKPRFHSAHTGITALRVRSKGRALLQFFNDTSHLNPAIVVPEDKRPWIEDPVTRRWHFAFLPVPCEFDGLLAPRLLEQLESLMSVVGA
jgi:broad specificity phosphatase PhoE